MSLTKIVCVGQRTKDGQDRSRLLRPSKAEVAVVRHGDRGVHVAVHHRAEAR